MISHCKSPPRSVPLLLLPWSHFGTLPSSLQSLFHMHNPSYLLSLTQQTRTANHALTSVLMLLNTQLH